jgi:hypothetical protein
MNGGEADGQAGNGLERELHNLSYNVFDNLSSILSTR